MEIILASASPRRRELLEKIGLDFKVVPAKGEERADPGAAPDELVKRLSRQKALEVAENSGPEAVIIAADTIVVLDGKVLGKPRDKENAIAMLKKLSGRCHTVFTGLTVIRGETVITRSESASVRFREMSAREILAYVETGEPMDKAGAYGAQGIGALFVEKIEGNFFTVMGLPLCALGRMLENVGVTLI